MDLTRERLLEVYRTMRRIRSFEDRLGELVAAGKMGGFMHLYAGEEAIAVGVCAQLEDVDLVASTHRGHGHCIAKGVEIAGDTSTLEDYSVLAKLRGDEG